MQERRTTIRVPYACRAQLCQAEDFLPRDGRLFNLSERGAGVLTRSVPKSGERLTVSFALPGEGEPLIATGVVRWSDGESPRRWHALGMEWLPLDEGTRSRLHHFIYAATQQPLREAPARSAGSWIRPAVRRALIILALIGTAITGGVLYLWVLSLQRETRTLTATVSQREAMIGSLQQHRARLTSELGEAKASLAVAAGEAARLDQQARQLGANVGHLTDEAQQMQQAYSQVSDERDHLTQRVLALEQERASFQQRLSSVDELRLAIQEAVEARRQASAVQRQVAWQERRASDLQWLAHGNQGYLVRQGKSTLVQPAGSGGGIRIRVLEPEAAAPFAPSSHAPDP